VALNWHKVALPFVGGVDLRSVELFDLPLVGEVHLRENLSFMFNLLAMKNWIIILKIMKTKRKEILYTQNYYCQVVVILGAHIVTKIPNQPKIRRFQK
jgi:hypothetical protein